MQRRRPPRGLVIAVAVLAGLLAGLWALAWFGPIAHPTTIQISGTPAGGKDAKRIATALEEAAAKQSTFHVDNAALMAAVSQYPQVAGIAVSAHPPFRLDLEVEIRPAVARVRIGGQPLVVAGDGTVLSHSTEGNLPTIDASVRGMTLRGGAVRAPSGALAVVGAAPEPLLELAKTLRVGDSGLEMVMDRGPRLIFGDGDEAAEKWAAAAAVLAEGGALQATYIDLRVPARPAVGGLQPSPDSTPIGVDAPPTLGTPSSAPVTQSGPPVTQSSPPAPSVDTPAQSGAAAPAGAGATPDTASAPAAGTSGTPSTSAADVGSSASSQTGVTGGGAMTGGATP